MLVSTISILLVAAYLLSKRFQDNATLSRPPIEMLRIGVQIICGDCCGDSDRPIKTYLDQFGRCGQCGGRSYVLASVCARQTLMFFPSDPGGTKSNVRGKSVAPPASLHAVRVHKISA